MSTPAHPTSPRRATIRDVAGLANVSIGTVSNVLNRPELVIQETRDRVLDAVHSLAYQPHAAAQAMATRETTAVGLVIADLDNILFADIARGADEELEVSGQHLLFANSQGSAVKQEWNVGFLASAGVGSLILAPINGELVGFEQATRMGKPVVAVDALIDTAVGCSVSADEELGGYLAAKHLIDQQCTRLTFIGNVVRWSAVRERYEGVLRAVSEADTGATVELMATLDIDFAAGYEAGSELARRPASERPDGVVAASDLLSVGCNRAFQHASDTLPADSIALIGFDDSRFALSTDSSASTVLKPGVEMGRAAVRLLRQEVLEVHGHVHTATVLPPALVARGNSKPAATAS